MWRENAIIADRFEAYKLLYKDTGRSGGKKEGGDFEVLYPPGPHIWADHTRIIGVIGRICEFV